MAIRKPRSGSLSPREHAQRAKEHSALAQHHTRAALSGAWVARSAGGASPWRAEMRSRRRGW